MYMMYMDRSYDIWKGFMCFKCEGGRISVYFSVRVALFQCEGLEVSMVWECVSYFSLQPPPCVYLGRSNIPISAAVCQRLQACGTFKEEIETQRSFSVSCGVRCTVYGVRV